MNTLPLSNSKIVSKWPQTAAKQGSALLLTLLVTSLLLVIVLAFVTFVRMEFAGIISTQERYQAQANARLALNLAIARLQESAGPDARSTAAAAALENAAPPLSPVTRHWTGVWKSPAGTEGAGHRRAHAEQVAWLVSLDPASATPDNPGTYAPALDAEGRPTQPGDILLVGPGSVGTANPDAHVVAPWQPIDTDNRNGYAYWVADESQKALINEMTVTPGAPIDLRMETQAPGGIAADLAVRDGDGDPILTQTPGLDRSDPNGIAAWNRSMNSGHAGMVFSSPALSDMIQNQFHEVTYRNSGLQVNARDGGLKKDLSIAFEVEDDAFHRSEFSQELSRVDGSADPAEWSIKNRGESFQVKPVYNEFLNSADGKEYIRNSNTDYTLSSANVGASDVFRGPTWSQIRNHYQQYLDVKNPFTNPEIPSVPSEPNLMNDGSYKNIPTLAYYFGRNKAGDLWGLNGDASDAPITDERGSTPRPRFSRSNRMPILTRVTSYYAIKTGDTAPGTHTVTGKPGKELAIENNAIVTLHNPYNTRLTVPGLYISQVQSNYYFELRINGEISGDQWSTLPISTKHLYQDQPHVTSRYTYFDHMGLVLTKNGNGSTDPIVFEPGEVKIFTAVNPSSTQPSPKGVIFLREGITANPLDHGYSLTNLKRKSGVDPSPYYIYEEQEFSLKIEKTGFRGNTINKPRYGTVTHAEYMVMRYGLMNNDNIQDAFDPGVNKQTFDDSLFWEQAMLLMPTEHMTSSPFTVPVNYNVLDNGDGYYMFYQDLYRKPTTSFDSLTEWTDVPMELQGQFNQRAPIQRSEFGGGFGKDGTRLPLNWDLAVPDDANTDVGSIPNLNRLAFNVSEGRGYWGNTLGSQGQDQLILYEIPSTPILSLGALQHANIGLFVNEPDQVIGNSAAQADLPRNSLWGRREMIHHDGWGYGEYFYWFDTAYLMNEALWDGYFFSGAATPENAAGDGFSTSRTVSDTLDGLPDGSTRLLNPRMRFELPENVDLTEYASDTDLDAYASPETSQGDLRPHDAFARYLRTVGMFNVNSTSPAAWAALLGSLRDASVAHYDDLETPLTVTHLGDASVFPRMSVSGTGPGAGVTEFFNGFRELSDADIDLLAEAIVDQVEKRIALHGPFRSLAQFVNRWYPEGTDDIDLAGALREAIIQAELNMDFDTDPEIAESAQPDYFKTYIDDETFSEFPTPEAFRQSSAAGFGQYLTQGNLLSLIGPGLTVRGDTFKIRAHGQLRNAQTGEPTAQAWCEAVVERQSAYLDADAAHPATPPDGLAAGGVNDRFGRRFKIVSFRWLSPDEI